jgi:superfamily II DNA or RNA helicase
VPFSAGDTVLLRGERWRIEDLTSYPDATLITLESADHPHGRCRVLWPFDRPVSQPRVPAIRVVGRRRWMHQLHSRLADIRIFGQLQTTARASIDILPFQLEPALALVRGLSPRLLLADEVGLGKTIQAGLILAELQQRKSCEHALILTPSGLRQQWADELTQRFDIRASIIDAASLSTLNGSLPFDVNPWSVEPVVVSSIDFIKQPEVLNAAAAQLWDVLIVDEAHQASVGSLRYDAVDTLANVARHILLLTATPHSGDEAAYRALCALGETRAREPMLLFRRTREQAGLPRTRRVHLLSVRQTTAGMDMHRLLEAYVGRLWRIAHETGQRDLRLAAMILAKRAFSSARSLALSLERRLSRLGEPATHETQGRLIFADDDADDEAVVPTLIAFDRPEEEREALQVLIAAARRAEIDEPKVRVLNRILGRIQEPVILFTEYRDTLEAIAAAFIGRRQFAFLHGGQTAEERRHAVRNFSCGAADALLATDAGSEGLNLQSGCRLVVNLELPWNPMRLEQRIGRVDRIGQARTVHAINLFAAGTAESTVLARLVRRLDRIRLSEIEIAAHVISGSEPRIPPAPLEALVHPVDLATAARDEADRIAATRAMYPSRAAFENRVAITTFRPSFGRSRIPHPSFTSRSLIVFVRIHLVDGRGHLVEDTLVPIQTRVAPQMAFMGRSDIKALVETHLDRLASALISAAKRCADLRARTIEIDAAAASARLLKREHKILESVQSSAGDLIQGGLFDNRAVARQRDALAQRDARLGESSRRIAHLEANARIVVGRDPEVELVVLVC